MARAEQLKDSVCDVHFVAQRHVYGNLRATPVAAIVILNVVDRFERLLLFFANIPSMDQRCSFSRMPEAP
jgi:hypothetical protein